MTDLDNLFDAQGGVVTTAQLLGVYRRSRVDTNIRRGDLIKVWPGIYSRAEPDTMTRLRGLDLRAGEPVAVCLGTAAAAYVRRTRSGRRGDSAVGLAQEGEEPLDIRFGAPGLDQAPPQASVQPDDDGAAGPHALRRREAAPRHGRRRGCG